MNQSEPEVPMVTDLVAALRFGGSEKHRLSLIRLMRKHPDRVGMADAVTELLRDRSASNDSRRDAAAVLAAAETKSAIEPLLEAADDPCLGHSAMDALACLDNAVQDARFRSLLLVTLSPSDPRQFTAIGIMLRLAMVSPDAMADLLVEAVKNSLPLEGAEPPLRGWAVGAPRAVKRICERICEDDGLLARFQPALKRVGITVLDQLAAASGSRDEDGS